MKIRSNTEGTMTTLWLAGPIDEHTEQTLGEALKGIKTLALTLDLAEVDYINSPGVRGWILAMRLCPPGVKPRFERCSIVFMDYRSLVPRMTQGGEIASVLVPYRCDACNKDESLLFAVKDLKKDQTPSAVCKKCGAAMACDASDGFFDFMA